jgi:hypothetical protein
MAYHVAQDPRRNWLLVRFTGKLTIDEVIRLIRTVRAEPEYRLWPMLVDARHVSTDATEQDIERAVAAVQHAVLTEGTRGHVAIAASDDVLYARLLLYETRCAEIGVRVIRVFRQLPDAQEWLTILSQTRNFH